MLPETAGPVGVNREGGTNFIPTIRKSIVTGSEQHDHEIKAENSTKLYKCINLLNGMGFKVNSDLLDYLKTSAGSHLLELNLDSKSEKERTQLEMINSNCLAIAETYRDQTFYFNTFIDWRGRIYTHAFYLDYQGSELSLALIHMALGKQLSPKGKFYLMVYGANCYNYGGNLKKQSLEDRVKWISDNEESVLSLNPSFIKKAENPILFTAFALEYIKHHKNSSAKIYLPIFLDSTCSGIQHLAAMLGDRKLAADVNLIPNVSKVNGETPVKDVYSNALKKLNHKLSSSVQDKKECFDMIQIREVSLTRKILKKALMTKVYGVTIYGIFDQLKSSFSREIEEVVDSSGEKTKIYVYYAPSKLPGHVKLSSNQLFKLARIISENLFKFNPALEELYDYLSSTVKLMVKLNIPIV